MENGMDFVGCCYIFVWEIWLKSNFHPLFLSFPPPFRHLSNPFPPLKPRQSRDKVETKPSHGSALSRKCVFDFSFVWQKRWRKAGGKVADGGGVKVESLDGVGKGLKNCRFAKIVLFLFCKLWRKIFVEDVFLCYLCGVKNKSKHK